MHPIFYFVLPILNPNLCLILPMNKPFQIISCGKRFFSLDVIILPDFCMLIDYAMFYFILLTLLNECKMWWFRHLSATFVFAEVWAINCKQQTIN